MAGMEEGPEPFREPIPYATPVRLGMGRRRWPWLIVAVAIVIAFMLALGLLYGWVSVQSPATPTATPVQSPSGAAQTNQATEPATTTPEH